MTAGGCAVRRTVLLTRAVEQAVGTAARLRALGYGVVMAPLVRIVRIPARIHPRAQAILVTSRNGAEALAAATPARTVPVLAVGEATAAALRDAGFSDVHSADGDAQGLAALALRRLDPAHGPVLHARGAEIRRSPLVDLRATGFEVAEAILYRTEDIGTLPPLAATCDTALVYSPGSARRLAAALPPRAAPLDIVAISDAALAPLRDTPLRTTLHAAPHPSEAAMFELLATLPKNPVADASPFG